MDDKGQAKAFVEDAYRELRGDPTVSVWLSVSPDGRVCVEQIWAEKERGVGHGRRTMGMLLRLADEHEVELVLTPHWLAYDTERLEDEDEADRLDKLNETKLDNDQLRAWYERLGFVVTGEIDGDDPVMARPPSPALGNTPGPG